MDCVVVRERDGSLLVKEFRHLKLGEIVACGRRENGEDGIFVHTDAFSFQEDASQKFAFRTRITRETSFSIDYDQLYELLSHEQKHGFIVWVLGPAVVFDRDAREAFAALVENGYVHALLAGNALAVHDVEAALFKTALGQEIYSKRAAANNSPLSTRPAPRLRVQRIVRQQSALVFLSVFCQRGQVASFPVSNSKRTHEPSVELA
jgi:hypothetical protein